MSDDTCFEGGEDSHLEAAYEERTELPDGFMEEGLGDDMSEFDDDFAMMNQNEADDYQNE